MTPQSDVRTILIRRGNQPPSASVVGDHVIVLELEISCMCLIKMKTYGKGNVLQKCQLITDRHMYPIIS